LIEKAAVKNLGWVWFPKEKKTTKGGREMRTEAQTFITRRGVDLGIGSQSTETPNQEKKKQKKGRVSR